MKQKKSAVILVNLGSPVELTVKEIKRFLVTFLSDRRVVDLPKLLWYPILYGIILPFRSRRLLKQYQQIQIDGISPLIYYTQKQAINFDHEYGEKYVIRSAFSYSKPMLESVLLDLHKTYTIDSLTIVPLYPQFSSTTTSPIFDQLGEYYRNKKYLPKIKFIRSFCDNEIYIALLVKQIKRSFEKRGRGDKIVFSYHSLPEVIIQAGDEYLNECVITTNLIVDQLNLKDDDFIITFQSKFGRQKWLSPATNTTLIELAQNGIKNVDIVCPGFISDCLETLEEIAITNKALFIQHGGSNYNYIHALNNDPGINKLLFNLCEN